MVLENVLNVNSLIFKAMNIKAYFLSMEFAKNLKVEERREQTLCCTFK